MIFKNFEIRRPTCLSTTPEEYYKYNFDLVKWADDHSHCWSIGFFRYDKKNGAFDFESVGLRYLEDREPGLEEILLKWCAMQTEIIKREDEEE